MSRKMPHSMIVRIIDELFSENLTREILTKEYLPGHSVLTNEAGNREVVLSLKIDRKSPEDVQRIIRKRYVKWQIENPTLNVDNWYKEVNDHLEQLQRSCQTKEHLQYIDIYQVQTKLVYNLVKENQTETIHKNIVDEIEIKKIVDKVHLLKELGIIEFLKEKFPISTSTRNQLSVIVSQIIGEERTSVQPIINALEKDDIASKHYSKPSKKVNAIVGRIRNSEM